MAKPLPPFLPVSNFRPSLRIALGAMLIGALLAGCQIPVASEPPAEQESAPVAAETPAPAEAHTHHAEPAADAEPAATPSQTPAAVPDFLAAHSTAAAPDPGSPIQDGSEVLRLKEGDSIRISFPGVPTMDTTQQVRPDGRVALPMIGEYRVAGKTTEELNRELLDLYAPKLVSKEVTVTLVASPFPVYVTGAVMRPGKITADRRVTAFDAIMEAGGFDKGRANLRKVFVLRQENGRSQRYDVNLQDMIEGKGELFYLKPFDTVYVPDKFRWF